MNERPESAWLYLLRTSEAAQWIAMIFTVLGMVFAGIVAADLIAGREPELIEALRTAALEMTR
jgi:hypothetical protein